MVPSEYVGGVNQLRLTQVMFFVKSFAVGGGILPGRFPLSLSVSVEAVPTQVHIASDGGPSETAAEDFVGKFFTRVLTGSYLEHEHEQ